MIGAALALVQLLLSGCSGSDGDPAGKPPPSPTPTTSSPGESDKSPRERLRAAQKGLLRAVGVSYYRRVYVGRGDEPSIAETGKFALRRQVSSLTRTMVLPPSLASENNGSSFYQLSIRSSKDIRFFQLANWGPYDGCWAGLDNDTLRDLFAERGIELDLSTVPVPAALVLTAQVSGAAAPVLATRSRVASVVPASSTVAEERVAVVTNGANALQMLGISAEIVAGLDPATRRVSVPMSITYFVKYPDAVQTLALDGRKVIRALGLGGVRLPEDMADYLAEVRAGAGFSSSTIPVEFERPPANQVLPSALGPGVTCEINR